MSDYKQAIEDLAEVMEWLDKRGVEVSPVFAVSGNTGPGEFVYVGGLNGPHIVELGKPWDGHEGWMETRMQHTGEHRLGGFLIRPGAAMKLQERND